tara:strand:- start:16035 stop:16928 length:894 start_codon:yes stop_codon:yes gene_type:complete
LTPLKPHLVYKPWGGTRLGKLKGLTEKAAQDLGETWEISRLEEGLSFDEDQVPLSRFSAQELPYLVKFIDTTKPLSVQVHPHDKYAERNENCLGKTECWLILEADVGAGIYLGFNENVTEEDFFADVESGADLTKYLQFHPVKRGDFFYVPAGTIHALGAGITLAEIQQSSGVTYRVWDWNRVDENGKSRELHIEQAKAVLNFSPAGNDPSVFRMTNIFESNETDVLEHPQFKISYYSGSCERRVGVEKRISSVISLSDLLALDCEGTESNLKPYECCIVRNGSELRVTGGKFLVVE